VISPGAGRNRAAKHYHRSGRRRAHSQVLCGRCYSCRSDGSTAYYLNLALDIAVKPGEISEIITHLAFYSGWANAISAAKVSKNVFSPGGCMHRWLVAELRARCRTAGPSCCIS
jgi:hypothetical protein